MSSNEKSTKKNKNGISPEITYAPKSGVLHNLFSRSPKNENSNKDATVASTSPSTTSVENQKHASAPAPTSANAASERTKSISAADSASFAELMEKTKGMTPEETKTYLASLPRDNNQGMRITRGDPSYMQVGPAFGGAMGYRDGGN